MSWCNFTRKKIGCWLWEANEVIATIYTHFHMFQIEILYVKVYLCLVVLLQGLLYVVQTLISLHWLPYILMVLRKSLNSAGTFLSMNTYYLVVITLYLPWKYAKHIVIKFFQFYSVPDLSKLLYNVNVPEYFTMLSMLQSLLWKLQTLSKESSITSLKLQCQCNKCLIQHLCVYSSQILLHNSWQLLPQ